MKMRTKILPAFVAFLTIYGCDKHIQRQESVQNIEVDTSIAKDQLDISDLLDLSTIKIIKLETNENCYLSSDGVIQIHNDNIIIGDEISKRLALFNQNGKFVKNIGRPGRGPGEYVQLGSSVVINDSIYVQDASQDKIVVYSIKDDGFREITLDPAIYYVDLFAIGDKNLYFITNYASLDKKQTANLVRMNLETGERKYLLPYNHDIEDKGQAWGLNKYTSTCLGEALAIYGRNDTIYRVSNDGVHAEYRMNFIQNKIPASLLHKDASVVLAESLDKGYNFGLDRINNLADYFIGVFSEGVEKSYNLIYRKSDGNISLGKSMIISGLGGLQILNFTTTEANEIVLVYDIHVLKTMWTYGLSAGRFTDDAMKDAMQKIVESSQDNENPILITAKLKPTIVI